MNRSMSRGVCRGCVAKRGESRVSRRRGRPPHEQSARGSRRATPPAERTWRGRAGSSTQQRRQRAEPHARREARRGERRRAVFRGLCTASSETGARQNCKKKHPPAQSTSLSVQAFSLQEENNGIRAVLKRVGKGKSVKAISEIWGPKDQSRLSQQAGGQEEELLLVLWFLASGLRPGLSQVSPPSIPRALKSSSADSLPKFKGEKQVKQIGPKTPKHSKEKDPARKKPRKSPLQN